VTDDTIGVFHDKVLQNLYDDLVSQGRASLVEAFKVGLTIEDLDIYDLKEALANTDNQDITKVYQNLKRGSRNHLRAFTRQLNQNGGSYTAQFLSQSEIDEIASSPQEKGGHGKKREGNNSGRGQGQGYGQNFQQSSGYVLEEVRPTQRQWGRGQGQGNRGQGRGWGRQSRNNSFSGQPIAESSRSFYHFFSSFFVIP
jgi:hypothetical protein